MNRVSSIKILFKLPILIFLSFISLPASKSNWILILSIYLFNIFIFCCKFGNICFVKLRHNQMIILGVQNISKEPNFSHENYVPSHRFLKFGIWTDLFLLHLSEFKISNSFKRSVFIIISIFLNPFKNF